jgi:hypothetical protein
MPEKRGEWATAFHTQRVGVSGKKKSKKAAAKTNGDSP